MANVPTHLRSMAANLNLVQSAVMWLALERRHNGLNVASATTNSRSMVANPNLALNADKSLAVDY